MMPDADAVRARRYLLGQASEAERSAIEQEYFRTEEALDRIASAEDDLIEAYLTDRLDAVERQIFEREYLASPHHRRRVDTVRALRTSSSSLRVRSTYAIPRWLSVAAAVVLLAASLAWLFDFSRERPDSQYRGPAVTTAPPTPANQAPTVSPAAPRVFAVSISPVAVRSTAEPPAVVLPAGTDLVSLTLIGEPDGRRLVSGRVTLRRVSGGEVWQGPAMVGSDVPHGAVARVNVPAARVTADDYIVALLGSEAAGDERERYRYFLRVRAQ